MVLVLSNPDVEELLSMKECVDSIEDAYRELALGRATYAPRRDSYLRGQDAGETYYRLTTMEGGVRKLGIMTQRIDSEMIQYQRRGETLQELEIPNAKGRYCGLVFLYSSENLELLAVMNDGQIQRMRVAGTSGVGARHLARRDATKLAMLGSGEQAETQLMAMCAVRGISKVKVYSPNPEKRARFAQNMGKKLGVDISATDTPQEAVRGADIVNAATNAEQPVFSGEWIEQGMHLSQLKHKEFDDKTWRRSDLVYVSCPLGVYSSWAVHGLPRNPMPSYDPDFYRPYVGKTFELTDLLIDKTPGRTSDSQVTFFWKGLALGIEFAAAGKVVYDLALKKGKGHEIPTDWFVQNLHP